MADLIAIYNEFGLTGIVPHAIRRNAKGFQMLVDKINQGDKLFYLESLLNVPYIIIKDESYQTPVFTSRALAEAEQSELLNNRCPTRVNEIPTGEGREQFMVAANNSGISALFIDSTISMQLLNFCVLPSYDGLPHENLPLRNVALNGSTYYYLQFLNGHNGNNKAEHRWASCMKQGKFLLAVEDSPNDNYPIITKSINGKTAYMVYTDWALMRRDFEPSPAGVVISFDELDSLLEISDTTILLNNPTAHIFLDRSVLALIRKGVNSNILDNTDIHVDNHSTPHSVRLGFDQVPEEEWETADPMPEWLKIQ